MSLTIPKGTMPLCFLRGQTVRGVGAELYVAQTQLAAGSLKKAKLMLGLAKMGLETLADISPQKVVKEAASLRKRLIAARSIVDSRKTSAKTKAAAVKALSDDFQKLEKTVGLSCGYEA